MKNTFKNRDFWFALLGFFFTFLSITLFYLFPLFLDQFNPSKTRVGLIMGVHSITAIVVRPFFGGLIDKHGAKRMTLYGILFMFLVVPWFHLVESAGLLAFFLRGLGGVGWGIGMTAAMAMCSDLAPLDRLAHSLGIIGVAGIVSGAVGPMLAEEIVRYYGFGGIFNASLALLAGGMICVLATREIPRSEDTIISSRSDKLKSYPIFIVAIIGSMPIVHGAVRGVVINFIALFGTSAGFSRVAPFFVAFSAAAVITRLGIGDISDRYGRKRVILPAALLISLNLFWIAGIDNYVSFIVSGFIAGLGQGLIFPALSTYLIDFLGRGNKGFALALYMSLFDTGMGLGSPLFGWISDMVGYRKMYMAAGLLLFIFTLIFSIKAPHPDETR